ncbi:S1 family peptidase [Hellea balneolensis]|uniref:S1 family peptidase n=1 Tax=Hellea balneolensis TaxID=287478 RepID=UPI00138ACC8F|nr:serine protease [Hellea balneolensis]
MTGHLAVADWFMIVKDEGGTQTVVQSSDLEGSWQDINPISFDLTITSETVASNNLYIISVGQGGGAMMAYLSGALNGDKTVLTGSPLITVLKSNIEGYSYPEAPEVTELIRGQLGGSYGPTQSVARDAVKNVDSLAFPSRVKSAAGNKNPPAIWWSRGLADAAYDSEYVVFKIPYSALFNPPVTGGRGDAQEDALTLAMDRQDFLNERRGMREYIAGLTNIIKEREHELRVANAKLDFTENGTDVIADVINPMEDLIETQKNRLKTQSETLNDNTAEMNKLKDDAQKLENEIQRLKDVKQPASPGASTPAVGNAVGISMPAAISGGLGVLSLGGLAGLMLGRRRHNQHCNLHTPPIKREEEEREKSQGFDTLKKGMAFAASPMLLGGLPPALAAIKPVYDAVGRIGFAQKGKPVGEDESFGTGILISDHHILTNRHVWEMFKHRLTSDEPTGIEFYGEKKSDKSDFVTFADDEPVCIDGWDAAIFTLSRTPENRKPVTITPRPAKSLNDLDIVVVGYPQAQRVTDTIEDVTEKDPIFGVKRYSEGKIFRHSVDTENPYGVEAAVESIINPSETMRAVCHNASTLGGSSGSAVICKKTGELIALHFGFDSAYEWEEAANFAVAGENLADKVANIIQSVTAVTDRSAQAI